MPDPRYLTLPAKSTALDRGTLRLWRAWRSWVLPWMLGATLLFVVSEAVAVIAFKLGAWLGGESINVQHWSGRLSATRWSLGLTATWTIAWTLIGFALASIALMPLLRRHHRPLTLAVGAALPTAIFFIIGSDNLRVRPFGSDASYPANVFALLALWGVIWMPLTAAIAARRDRKSLHPGNKR